MSKPETVFKVGAVRAAVFRNTIEKAGKSIPLPKVVIEVRYKDKMGQWKGTNTLSLNDIPKAILALQKAFEYLTTHKGAWSPGKRWNRPPIGSKAHFNKSARISILNLPTWRTQLTFFTAISSR
jgi:hypothetical protein